MKLCAEDLIDAHNIISSLEIKPKDCSILIEIDCFPIIRESIKSPAFEKMLFPEYQSNNIEERHFYS